MTMTLTPAPTRASGTAMFPAQEAAMVREGAAAPSNREGEAVTADSSSEAAGARDTTAGTTPPAAAKILVVDDEPAIVDAVTYNLRQHGYQPLIASDAEAALRLFREKQPDLILLDVMLPSGSGFDVCRLVRQSGSTVPVLMLTARVAETDRVHGLETGADDYLVKPFGMRELIARIKALLRRQQMTAAAVAAASGSGENGATAETADASPQSEGYALPQPARTAMLASAMLNLVIDVERREVRLQDKPISLSRKEFDLLALIAAHPGRVFDRQTLLDRVWGEDAYVDDRTVDVHIRWLREKIEPVPGKPQHILTVRGVGYKFQS